MCEISSQQDLVCRCYLQSVCSSSRCSCVEHCLHINPYRCRAASTDTTHTAEKQQQKSHQHCRWSGKYYSYSSCCIRFLQAPHVDLQNEVLSSTDWTDRFSPLIAFPCGILSTSLCSVTIFICMQTCISTIFVKDLVFMMEDSQVWPATSFYLACKGVQSPKEMLTKDFTTTTKKI